MNTYSWRENYRLHYACFHCRTVLKQIPWLDPSAPISAGLENMRVVKCPRCGCKMPNLGRNFKAPPRSNLSQWRKIQLLYQNGWRGYGWAVRPKMTLRAAKTYLGQRPRRELKAKRSSKQQVQNEKWRKSRKWPVIKPSKKSGP